ncbi:MAG: acetylxylan esterase [Candidatus Solibacter sp.]
MAKTFTRWPAALLLAGLLGVPAGTLLFRSARAAEKLAPPVKMTKEEDRQKMMDALGIKELRRGKAGRDKTDPNFANYDESKANPYPKLPDPLTLKNGKKVTKAADWWSKRRPEIVEDFDREVYGRMPKNTPKVKWEVVNTTTGKNGDVDIVTKQLLGVVDNSSYPDIEVKIQLSLTTPANAKGPVPVIMQFGGGFGAPGGAATAPREGPPYGPNAFSAARGGFGAAGAPGAARGAIPGAPGAPGSAIPGAAVPGAAAAGAERGLAGPGGRGPQGPTWQQQVLAKGWGYASLNPGSIQADNGDNLTLGIIGLVNKGQPRKPDDWGSLRAWAWGASRAIDYFETDKAVDVKHVAIEGHSRYGKAAVVALAYEPRMWTAYVSSSGEGGAKLHRRNWGEIIENVAATSEYHWMAGNFLKYAGPKTWDDLPVDSHELIAMCAPRPVYLSAGKGGYDDEPNGDSWVDAKGTFLAGAGAGPVYRLLGAKDIGVTEFPARETEVGADADVAFRQHASGHTDGPNWPYFLDFAAKHLTQK